MNTVQYIPFGRAFADSLPGRKTLDPHLFRMIQGCPRKPYPLLISKCKLLRALRRANPTLRPITQLSPLNGRFRDHGTVGGWHSDIRTCQTSDRAIDARFLCIQSCSAPKFGGFTRWQLGAFSFDRDERSIQKLYNST